MNNFQAATHMVLMDLRNSNVKAKRILPAYLVSQQVVMIHPETRARVRQEDLKPNTHNAALILVLHLSFDSDVKSKQPNLISMEAVKPQDLSPTAKRFLNVSFIYNHTQTGYTRTEDEIETSCGRHWDIQMDTVLPLQMQLLLVERTKDPNYTAEWLNCNVHMYGRPFADEDWIMHWLAICSLHMETMGARCQKTLATCDPGFVSSRESRKSMLKWH
ncbi:hypothetical protein CBL_00810 [Carabus blaptoides fortunei]